MNCYLCKSAPPIKDSHVVPNFMSKHIKKNSPFGYMLNVWSKKPKHDLHKGPYFCKKCDNEVISGWEGFFANKIWRDPLGGNSYWGARESLSFILSLAYRYAIHFIETSPMPGNLTYSRCVLKVMEDAILDNSKVGKSLFIYPYVHQEITDSCALIPGINHLLSLAAHGQSLPKEGALPNAFLVIVPKMIFLFCDQNLATVNEESLADPVHLEPGRNFDPLTSNTDMPIFMSSILNGLINAGVSHQKNIGRFKKMAYGTDKILNPNKICYEAQSQDQLLSNWQRKNCANKTLQRGAI